MTGEDVTRSLSVTQEIARWGLFGLLLGIGTGIGLALAQRHEKPKSDGERALRAARWGRQA